MTSRLGNAYVGTRFLASLLLAPLAYSVVASPAIVRAEEKITEARQEVAESENKLPISTYISLPKIDGREDYARVIFLNDKFYWEVRDRVDRVVKVNGEMIGGFEKWENYGATLEYLRNKRNNVSTWTQFLNGNSGITPALEDYKRVIFERLYSTSPKFRNKNDASVNATSSDSNQIKPQNPQLLEDRIDGIKEFTIKSSKGPIYVKIDGNSIYYEQGKIKGIMDPSNPKNPTEGVISVHLINSENGQLKREGEARYKRQLSLEEAVTNGKYNPRFNLGLRGNNTDGPSQLNANLEGFIPVYRGIFEGNNLVAIEPTAYVAKAEGKNITLEGILGIVINSAIDDKSMVQIGVFGQNRYDIEHSTNFGVVGGALAYKRDKIKLTFYAGIPVTNRQEIKSEDSRTTTTATTTSGGNTTTTTTQVDKNVREYIEARKVVSLTFEYDANDIMEGLKVHFGGAWYSGVGSYNRVNGDLTETRQGVSEEKKVILGFDYTLPWLSELFNRVIDVHAQARFGEGKSEFIGGIRGSFGQTYEEFKAQKKAANLVDLLTPLSAERIRLVRYQITKETTSRSPTISSTCPTTGSEGVLYTCTINYSGSTPTVITGPSSFLSLSNITATSAVYSGTPGFDAAGSYQIKIRVRGSNGLDAFKEWTLTIADVNRNPSVSMDSPSSDTTITAGQSVNFTTTASDPDGDSLSHSWTVTVVSGGAGPTINNVEDPGNVTFNNAGTYDIKDTVSDGKGGSATSATRRITVNESLPPPPG